jgi:hypothetical protein
VIAPKPKTSGQHSTTFAKGGKGTANRMFGKQAAGPAKPATTGKAQTAAPGAKHAVGGKGRPAGGTAEPVKPGRTGPRPGK